MRTRHKALLTAALLAVQLGAVAITAGSAQAATGPADDRQQTAPASWWSYTGVTAAQLSARLTANSARLTSIQMDDPATLTFTAVMVRNSGSYASAYWWYYGKTQAQVSSLLTSNHARLISASPYATGAGTRYAVVMVPNSGSNAKAWWWYVGSTSYLSSKLTANHARMIEVSPMPGSASRYLGLMVANTGSNSVSVVQLGGVGSATVTGTVRAPDNARASAWRWGCSSRLTTSYLWSFRSRNFLTIAQ